jgi:hypothetical protein
MVHDDQEHDLDAPRQGWQCCSAISIRQKVGPKPKENTGGALILLNRFNRLRLRLSDHNQGHEHSRRALGCQT